MQSRSLTSLWRQRFSCGTCAVALVGSLALYRKTVLTNPVAVAQTLNEENATPLPLGSKTGCQKAARSPIPTFALKRVFQGSEGWVGFWQFFSKTKFNSVQ